MLSIARPVFPGALLAALLLLLSGLARAGESGPLPDILLVTLDTTREDHLGCYGYPRETSPHIDRLAGESVVFDRCIVPMATTLPSHTSILTATYPLEHGVLGNIMHGGRRFAWTPRLRSFALFCRDLGYRTAAFVSASPLKRGTGIEGGFDTFDQPDGSTREAEPTTDGALAWLAEESGAPLFLWVHYYDPHYPYAAPGSFASAFRGAGGLESYVEERGFPPVVEWPIFGRKGKIVGHRSAETGATIDAYDGEILYMDYHVERLLAALRARPRWAETYVLVIGDHGEGLGQHGEAAHGGTWEEQLRVPMMIRAPGESPRRVERLVSSVDAIPTLIGLIGGDRFLPFLAQASGRDLLAGGEEAASIVSRETAGGDRGPTRTYALTSGRWKYLRDVWEGSEKAPDERLFDLENDPHERTDVAAVRGEVVRALADSLDRLLKSQVARGARLRATEEAAGPVDSVLLDELRSLGYVSE